MVHQLEEILQQTGHGREIALDMLTPRLYNIDVRIILDNSGSMSLDMMGENAFRSAGYGYSVPWIEEQCPYISVDSRGVSYRQQYYDLDSAFEAMWQSSQPCCGATNACAGCCGPNGPCPPAPVVCALLTLTGHLTTDVRCSGYKEASTRDVDVGSLRATT